MPLSKEGEWNENVEIFARRLIGAAHQGNYGMARKLTNELLSRGYHFDDEEVMTCRKQIISIFAVICFIICTHLVWLHCNYEGCCMWLFGHSENAD